LRPSQRSSTREARALADQLRKSMPSIEVHGQHDEPTELDRRNYDIYARWHARETFHFIGGFRGSLSEQPDLTSTLDIAAQQDLVASRRW
jgi:hypothetical protein